MCLNFSECNVIGRRISRYFWSLNKVVRCELVDNVRWNEITNGVQETHVIIALRLVILKMVCDSYYGECGQCGGIGIAGELLILCMQSFTQTNMDVNSCEGRWDFWNATVTGNSIFR